MPKPRTPSKDQFSGRIALARGPLGIVLAAFFLVEAVLGLLVGAQLAPAQATFLAYSMVFLALATLGGFFFVWIKRPSTLYSPDQFRDESTWLIAMGLQDVVASEPIPLERLERPPAPAAKANPAVPLEFLAKGWTELQGASGGFLSSTLIMELKKYLQTNASDWAYLTVDVGEGKTWLMSRLFIFVLLYRTASAQRLRCIVLVRGERLLGIADPARFCNAVASLYPWFNATLAEVLTARNISIVGQDTMDEWQTTQAMEDFIHKLQSPNDPGRDPDWARLSSGRWEKSRWLTAELVRTELSGALFDPKAAVLSRAAGTSDEDFAIEIMARDSPFVAEVGANGEFRKLYDKRRIFDRMMGRLRRPAQAA